MIDQAVNVSSGVQEISIEKSPPIVAVKHEDNNLTENDQLMSSPKQLKPAHRVLNSFGSRGSVMLRAALGDRNRQESQRQSSSGQQTLATKTSQPVAKPSTPKMAQQAMIHATPVNRERSSRNKVLFTDPVVSRKYEYEPTPVIQHLYRENRSNVSSGSFDDETDQQQLMTRQSLENKKRRQLLPAKRVQLDDEEDDDEEVFVLAPLDFPCLLDQTKKSPIKRPHELTLTSSEDDQDSCSAVDDHKSTKISLFQDDGCLFSSPKVAKIAPYYHNENEKERTKKLDFSKRVCLDSEVATDLNSATSWCQPSRFVGIAETTMSAIINSLSTFANSCFRLEPLQQIRPAQ